MALPTEQTPISQVLELKLADGSEPGLGRYLAEFPQSSCFGTVVVGGLVVAYIHKAASHFVSTNTKCNDHPHVLHAATQFFRPMLPLPKKAEVNISIANLAKELTTLYVEAKQGGKTCLVGHLTLTNLTTPKGLSMATGWQFLPPRVDASVEALESDLSQDWISYLTPFSATSYRKAQSYVRFHVPVKTHSRAIVDQWVTPGWHDSQASSGATWTNESIHFAIDNCLPMLNDVVGTGQTYTLHEAIIREGLAQRQARLEGRDEGSAGLGLIDSAPFPYIVSTISITTEIKRLLPPEGTKWLFMRVTTRSLLNNRLDYDIVVVDSSGDLIAVSSHVLQAIPVDLKRAQKSVL